MSEGPAMEVITRAALGNIASLGELYDARREDFCGISAFKEHEVPDGARKIQETSEASGVQLVLKDNITEKFSKLNISSELQASLLAGLVSLEGSGQYLNNHKASARSVEGALIYNLLTKEENINVLHEDFKKGLDIDLLESGTATHVVVGISWGACSIITYQYENKENRDVGKVGDILSTYVNKMAKYISGQVGAPPVIPSGVKFQIKIFSDIPPLNANEDLPATFEDAINVLNELPTLVAACNEGKGVPLTYHLIPIYALQNYLDLTVEVQRVPRGLEAAALKWLLNLFEDVSAAQQVLNDLLQDAKDYAYCIEGTAFLEKLNDLQDMVANSKTELDSEWSTILGEARSGIIEESDMKRFLEKFHSYGISSKTVNMALGEWADVTWKIKFARQLAQRGVKYIGYGSASLMEEISKNPLAKSYVLYFSQRARRHESWKSNSSLFVRALEERNDGHESKMYYVVDCDIQPTITTKDCYGAVQIFQNGAIIVDDLLAEQSNPEQISFARATSGTKLLPEKPKKQAGLVFPCPGKNCAGEVMHEWICKNCRQKFIFGFDDHAYCDCGKAPVVSLEYKCTNPQHGPLFQSYDTEYLKQVLANLQPLKEMNILILGETGVGKSTWINGFMNFLTYETLEDAENGELCTLIPSKFTVCNENFDEMLVSTGVDGNEVQQGGQSATQQAKVYQFTVGDTIIRLIDTPGIGDTRGIEQDKENFQNILSTLSNLEEIHGICILLKPNNARINVMFRFCIKELLTYLHRDASKNIMFCFTNSRGTFYRPGDTMPALKNVLSKNVLVEIPLSRDTVYCYDSEAYRFLAAVKNKPPVMFPVDERINFATSWEKSIAEVNRMLKHIRTLKPHMINSTLNLNHSRELVLKLARPLAEISRNIQTNKSIVEDEKREIEKTRESIQELKKRRMTTRTFVESMEIDHPKTVCSNIRCVKVWTLPNGTKTTEYVTVCHDHCQLTGVQKDSIGDPGLMQCWAMKDARGYCRHSNCMHHYKEHLHIYYDSVQVAKDVEDQSVVESLQRNLTATQMKQRMIEARNKEIEEYVSESEQIEYASVRFAYFLKSHAITPYNDAMEQYLNHLIQEEEEKVALGGNPVPLQNLKKTKESYVSQREILEKQMEKGSDEYMSVAPPSHTDVENLVAELKQLKHSGKALKDALECMNHTKAAVYNEAVMKNRWQFKRNRWDRNARCSSAVTDREQGGWEWEGLKKVGVAVGRFLGFRRY